MIDGMFIIDSSLALAKALVREGSLTKMETTI